MTGARPRPARDRGAAALASAALTAVLLAAAARAAPQPLPAEVQACAAITDDGARLACFDRVVGRPGGGSATGSPAPVAAGDPASTSASTPASGNASASGARPAESKPVSGAAAPLTPEQTFGLSAGEIRKLENRDGTNTPAPAALAAHIEQVTHGATGRQVFHLDNGQVWRQIEDRPGFHTAAGDAVTVTPGAFGSFWLSTSRHNSTRVERVP